MQFLTVLIEEAPSRMAEERASIAKLIDGTTKALDAIGARLDALPDELASGINPETISARINESLRQQFVATTIPQSGAAIARSAEEIDESVKAFARAAREIANTQRSTTAEATLAIRELDSAVRSAARSAHTATEALHQQASDLTWLSLSLGALAMFVLGFGVAFFALRG
jgi:methyl-accepting chemotaxis protein